jgi:hypothetical protein
MAKAITPKEAANLLTRKRGRPVGSKNKPEVSKPAHVLTFEKQLEDWDNKEKQIDLQSLCEKLQDALARSYVECEGLEKTNKALINEMNRQSCIIDYLESRIK